MWTCFYEHSFWSVAVAVAGVGMLFYERSFWSISVAVAVAVAGEGTFRSVENFLSFFALFLFSGLHLPKAQTI